MIFGCSKDDIYRASVVDEGVGIAPDVLPHIFEEGYTTKTDRSTPHGIGLAAVKRFVEERGGEISVHSEPGKGTMFEFTIPKEQIVEP